jgi:hypothetical protein
MGRVFTFVCACSLLLLVASVGLGLHSYRVGRLAKWGSAWLDTPLRVVERAHIIGVSRGTFVYSVTTETIDRADPLLASDTLAARRASTTQRFRVNVFTPRPFILRGARVVDLKVLQFVEARGRFATEHAVLIPFWVVAPLLAVLPGWWALRYRRRALIRRRLAAGQCLRCGYDLRAQQPGDPCPECGALHQPLAASGVV